MSQKVKFQGSTDYCEQLQHKESIGSGWQGQQMLMNIARHMDLTIMQADKTFWSTRLQRIFGRSNCIRRILWDIRSTWDERIPDKCEEFFVRLFRRKRAARQSEKGFSKVGEYFWVSCNNKSNREWLYEWQVYVVIHKDISVPGNCKSDGHKVSREHRRVSSESSGVVGDHL